MLCSSQSLPRSRNNWMNSGLLLCNCLPMQQSHEGPHRVPAARLQLEQGAGRERT